MKRGVLLFAHGARDPAWAAPFEAVAARLRVAHPTLEVRLAFLEFMQPGLVEAGEALADAGCTEATVVPLFLGAGGHVRKDVPALLERLKAARPSLQLFLQPAIGEHPDVVAAMANAAAAMVAQAESNEALSDAMPSPTAPSPPGTGREATRGTLERTSQTRTGFPDAFGSPLGGRPPGGRGLTE